MYKYLRVGSGNGGPEGRGPVGAETGGPNGEAGGCDIDGAGLGPCAAGTGGCGAAGRGAAAGADDSTPSCECEPGCNNKALCCIRSWWMDVNNRFNSNGLINNSKSCTSLLSAKTVNDKVDIIVNNNNLLFFFFKIIIKTSTK